MDELKTYRNIFLNVVTSENLMTELFRNLLSFKIFREPFIELFIERDKVKRIDFDDIGSQYFTAQGIPDLIVINEDYEIFIEIKIGNTSLTDNQPDGYLQYLKDVKNKEKWMIFLIPKDYMQLEYLKSFLSG